LQAQQGSGHSVTIDLSAVEFIDSTGLRLLLEAQADANHDGWDVAFEPNLPEQVSRLLDLTGVRGSLQWLPQA
jgi:anti-anti-sigma factor